MVVTDKIHAVVSVKERLVTFSGYLLVGFLSEFVIHTMDSFTATSSSSRMDETIHRISRSAFHIRYSVFHVKYF